jgi:hypothetical protein
LAGTPDLLADALKEEYWRSDAGTNSVTNPFGHGDSGERIARALWRALSEQSSLARPSPKSEIRN